jgi:hypothetical protein
MSAGSADAIVWRPILDEAATYCGPRARPGFRGLGDYRFCGLCDPIFKYEMKEDAAKRLLQASMKIGSTTNWYYAREGYHHRDRNDFRGTSCFALSRRAIGVFFRRFRFRLGIGLDDMMTLSHSQFSRGLDPIRQLRYRTARAGWQGHPR